MRTLFACYYASALTNELSEESELETEESDGSDPEYTGRGGDSDQDSDDEPDLRRTPPSGCAVKGGSYASGPASPSPADSGSPSCGPSKSPRRPKSRKLSLVGLLATSRCSNGRGVWGLV